MLLFVTVVRFLLQLTSTGVSVRQLCLTRGPVSSNRPSLFCQLAAVLLRLANLDHCDLCSFFKVERHSVRSLTGKIITPRSTLFNRRP